VPGGELAETASPCAFQQSRAPALLLLDPPDRVVQHRQPLLLCCLALESNLMRPFNRATVNGWACVLGERSRSLCQAA